VTFLGHRASLLGSERARPQGRGAGEEERDTRAHAMEELELAGGSAEFMKRRRAQTRGNDEHGAQAVVRSGVHVHAKSVSPTRRRNGKDVADLSNALWPSPIARARSGSMSPSVSGSNFFGSLSIEEKLLKLERERLKVHALPQDRGVLTTRIGVRGMTEGGGDSSAVAARRQVMADETREKESSNSMTERFRDTGAGKIAESLPDVGKNPARTPNASCLSAGATTVLLREDLSSLRSVKSESAEVLHSHGPTPARGRRQLFSDLESESVIGDALREDRTTPAASLAGPGHIYIYIYIHIYIYICIYV